MAVRIDDLRKMHENAKKRKDGIYTANGNKYDNKKR